jgi:hypothetical protein
LEFFIWLGLRSIEEWQRAHISSILVFWDGLDRALEHEREQNLA